MGDELGLTGLLYRTIYGAEGVGLTIPTIGEVPIPGLSSIPLVGRALFAQPLVTYALYLLVPLLAWTFARTHTGLALRAVGECPDAAQAAGVRPRRVQLAAVLLGGALAGVAGASLVLAQTGTFAEGMSAGKGFIAIAIVVPSPKHRTPARTHTGVFGSFVTPAIDVHSALCVATRLAGAMAQGAAIMHAQCCGVLCRPRLHAPRTLV